MFIFHLFSDSARLSPEGSTLSSCHKCGICFSDPEQFHAHRKLCGNRNRLLMPYDAPVNTLLHNGFDLDRGGGECGVITEGRKRARKGVVRRLSGDRDLDRMRDIEDDRWDESDEKESNLMNGDVDHDDDDFDSDDLKNSRNENIVNSDMEPPFRGHLRSEENFLLNLRNRMTNPLSDKTDQQTHGTDSDDVIHGSYVRRARSSEENEDSSEESEEMRRKRPKLLHHPIFNGMSRFDNPMFKRRDSREIRPQHSDEEDVDDNGENEHSNEKITNINKSGNSDSVRDRALAWALKAAGNGMLGGNFRDEPRGNGVPEEVSVFRNMLLQLQQQQVMQVS